jgi:FixJ family two-component response regulator
MSQCAVHLIDDDLSVRCAVVRLLRSNGHRVCTYASAAEFLSQQLDSYPSCLVLDLRLPGINGLDLQQLLEREHESVSVVFVSGYADIADSVHAMKAGAVDFLTKPFDDDNCLAQWAPDSRNHGRHPLIERRLVDIALLSKSFRRESGKYAYE